MNRVNGIDVFNKGIELSTKKDYLGSCYVTFAKNIKDISNTTAKPSFIKKSYSYDGTIYNVFCN